jgi:hypothetical protein
MNQIELLAELVEEVARDLGPQVEALSQEQLDWHPRPEGNSIGVTVWHLARGMDLLATRVMRGRPAEDELWHTAGWRDRTGYDPRGVGYGGWGVITGYTWPEVLAIPRLTPAEHVDYLRQAASDLAAEIRSLSEEAASEPASGLMDGKFSYREWVKSFYKGFQAHVGEIMAIKAMIAQQKI